MEQVIMFGKTVWRFTASGSLFAAASVSAFLKPPSKRVSERVEPIAQNLVGQVSSLERSRV